MDVYSELDAFPTPSHGTVLAIGNFDGVHRGHHRIVTHARAVAEADHVPVCVVTFEPHPLAVVAPSRAPERLVTLPEKLNLLRQLNVDACIALRSEPKLLSMTADEFVRVIVERCRPVAIVEGPDFHFGRGRTGSVETLQHLAPQFGYSLHVIDTERCEEWPDAPDVRSSAIRAALRQGRVNVAETMLGRPYRIVGTVEPGDGRGASLGFPTANLGDIPHLLPANAVYATVAQLENDTLLPAAVNVGPQPTFNQDVARVEAHVIGYNDSLVGQAVGLHFVACLRTQQRFEAIDELVHQLTRDVTETRSCTTHALTTLRDSMLPL